MKQFFRISCLILSSLLLIWSCDDRRQVKILQLEVEAIHDEPMQKLEELERMQSVAVKLLEEANATRRDSLNQFIRNAEAANEQMFEWMANYKAPDNSMSTIDATNYLKNQKWLAQDMSNAVLEAFEMGKKLTGK